jgi:hypothetical protein
MADDITIGIKTTADTSGVEAATTGFAGQTAALDRMKAAADAAAEKIRNLDSSNAVTAETKNPWEGQLESLEKFKDTAGETGEKVTELLGEKTANMAKDSAESLDQISSKVTTIGEAATTSTNKLNAVTDILRTFGQGELAGGVEDVAGILDRFGVRVPLRFAAIGTAAAAVGLALKEGIEYRAEEVGKAMDDAASSMEGAMIAMRSSAEESAEMLKAAQDEARTLGAEFDALIDKAERYNRVVGLKSDNKIADLRDQARQQLDQVSLGVEEYKATGGKSGISPEQAVQQKAQIKIAAANEEYAIKEAERNEKQKQFSEISDKAWDEYNKARQDSVEAQKAIADLIVKSKERARKAAETEQRFDEADKGLLNLDPKELAILKAQRDFLNNQVNQDNASIREMEKKAAEAQAKEAEAGKFIEENKRKMDDNRTSNQYQNYADVRTRDASVRDAENEKRRAELESQRKRREDQEQAVKDAADRARAAMRDRAEAARTGASSLGKDANAAVQAFGNDIAGALKDKELDDAELSKLSPQIRAALSSSNETVRILAETVMEIAREQKLLQERLRNRA